MPSLPIQIIILGSGTSIPLYDRASPCLAMIIEKTPIIFDMGPGALRQMAGGGLDFEEVGRIFITHFHPDHTADLVHFLFASRTPNIVRRRKPFVVSGPMGLKELVSGLQVTYRDWLTLPPDVMEIEELDVGKATQRDYENFRLITAPVNHTPHSLAYRVETPGGKAVVYSGDTGFCDEIVDLAKGADLLVLESAFPDGEEVEGHLTPSEAGHIAAMAEAKQLVLTHFYPQCLASDIQAQCRKTFQGKLIIGSDMLRITV